MHNTLLRAARGCLVEGEELLALQHGARARWGAIGKAAASLLLALAGALIATMISKALFGASLLELAQQGLAAGVGRAFLIFAAVVILPTALMLSLTREPFAFSGWSPARSGRSLTWGVASGAGLIAATAVILWASGSVTFHLAAVSASIALQGGALSVLLWLMLAAAEEGLHRGYAFVQLSRAISFRAAAALSSAWFMYGHIGNPGETVIGIVAAGLLALVLSYSVLRTGSLWFALGFHASWNFSQSFVFGFANSGGKSPASLFSADLAGSPYLTGGTAGPEGSILILPASLILIAVVRRLGTRVTRT